MYPDEDVPVSRRYDKLLDLPPHDPGKLGWVEWLALGLGLVLGGGTLVLLIVAMFAS